MGIKINALPDAGELTENDVLALDKETTGNTVKSSFQRLATWALSTFTLSLGSVTRTVKAAIDALQTSVTSHSNLLGSTSISGIGGGTVTGAISSLNSDLSKFSIHAGPSLSHTSQAANTWELAGSFTLPRDALVYVISTYNVRAIAIGFASSGAVSYNAPDEGYIAGVNHIYRTPVFILAKGTHYLFVQNNAVGTNTYSVRYFG